MFSLLKLIIGLGALTVPAVHATTYAQFCDDHACKVNCGVSLSVNNPSCLKQVGRGSIKFHGGNAQAANLIFTPGENCNCQEECYNVVTCAGDVGCGPVVNCFNLAGQKPAKSFRFVGGDQSNCHGNNCGVPP